MKRITAIMMVVCMLLCGCAMPDVGETQDQQMSEGIDTSPDTSGDVQPPEVPEIKEGFFEKDGQLYLYLNEFENATSEKAPNSALKATTLYDFSARFGSVSEALDKIGSRDFTSEQLTMLSRFPIDQKTGARMVADYSVLDRVRVSPELEIKDVLWSFNGCFLMCAAKNSDSPFTVKSSYSPLFVERDLVCEIHVKKAKDVVERLFENEDDPNITDTTLYGLPAKKFIPQEYSLYDPSARYYEYLSVEDESKKIQVSISRRNDGAEYHYYYITYKGEDHMIVIQTGEFKTEPTLEWILSLAELVPATKQ